MLNAKERIRPFYLKWLYFRLKPAARPQEWRTCWNYPSAHAVKPASGAPPAIAILPMVDWHTRMQRPQHLALALAARGRPCVYLNPHLGREFPHPVGPKPKLHLAQLAGRVWELHVGLPREPVFHHRMLRPEEIAALADAFTFALQTSLAAILCQFPVWLPLALELRRRTGAKLIYDCHDLISGFARIAPEIICAEDDLFKVADTVLFSALPLRDAHCVTRPWLAPKSALVRNAVDPGHFILSTGGSPPCAGYVGALDAWFDVQAVRAAALSLPDVEFRLLGRVDNPHVASLAALPNVRLAGEVPYSDLPQSMAHFSVGLIPFLKTPVAQSANPIKLYEYFACGLPVVSTPLPEVAAFQGLTYIAENPQDFARQVRRALADTDPDRRRSRRQVAERESWSARAAQIESLLAS